MTPPDLITTAFITGAVISTSVLSGLFGAAGGTLLIGLLLSWFNVGSAMAIYSSAQGTTNVSRAWIWRRAIDWRIVRSFVLGSAPIICVLVVLSFQIPKAAVFIGLGLVPFVSAGMPKRLTPSVSTLRGQLSCGALVSGLSMLFGSAGVTLDTFFLAGDLGRKTVVGTKAFFANLHHNREVRLFRRRRP